MGGGHPRKVKNPHAHKPKSAAPAFASAANKASCVNDILALWLMLYESRESSAPPAHPGQKS